MSFDTLRTGGFAATPFDKLRVTRVRISPKGQPETRVARQMS
jgi:hypothetical protein